MLFSKDAVVKNRRFQFLFPSPKVSEVNNMSMKANVGRACISKRRCSFQRGSL